jgi:hypothetical protein
MVGVLTFALVLACNVVNKLSLVALVDGFRFYHLDEPGNVKANVETHSTLLMMIMVVVIPQLLGFLSSMWASCYKVGGALNVVTAVTAAAVALPVVPVPPDPRGFFGCMAVVASNVFESALSFTMSRLRVHDAIVLA